jgi:hypothetical protein
MVTRRGVLTILATVVISLGLLLAPTYRGSQRATLLQVNGYNSLILAVPVAISIFGSLSSRLRLFAGLLMLLWVAAGAFTVGLFYLPIVACLLWPEKRQHSASGLLTIR